jgi:hypothetical protein
MVVMAAAVISVLNTTDGNHLSDFCEIKTNIK